MSALDKNQFTLGATSHFSMCQGALSVFFLTPDIQQKTTLNNGMGESADFMDDASLKGTEQEKCKTAWFN